MKQVGWQDIPALTPNQVRVYNSLRNISSAVTPSKVVAELVFESETFTLQPHIAVVLDLIRRVGDDAFERMFKTSVGCHAWRVGR